jgi:hypothetical protein
LIKASSSLEITPSASATRTIAAKWSLFLDLKPFVYKFDIDIEIIFVKYKKWNWQRVLFLVVILKIIPLDETD